MKMNIAETKINDIKLWDELRSGSRNSFIEFYDLMYPILYAHGLKYCFDKELMKEVLQEVFLEIWEKRNTLPEVNNVKGYLYAIVIRKINRSLSSKKHKTLPLENASQQTISVQSYEFALIESIKTNELKSRLQKALSVLTTKQKKIIIMKFFEDMSYEEISLKTGNNKRTVYNQIYEAIKILKKYLTLFLLILLY
ncbi:RNA polymerase sigma factor [Chondrinema litorale]|uniref:RNA polymerase sigma factor n=1 Tax=Chondrinema litorale TaxID=2994555 RepID=UPI00254338AE|nr:sigma-70 family RNA polymerase sigma factor [Chondrinema litorale]UZR98327.1 sigma-70 family RNA polymerase sigma factor [Chondrinema litorale]